MFGLEGTADKGADRIIDTRRALDDGRYRLRNRHIHVGGAGKVVSGNYRDTLTVTIAPKAAATATTSGGECSGLSGQF